MAFKIKLRRIPRKHLHEMIVAQQGTLNEMSQILVEQEAANSPLVHIKRAIKAIFRRRK